MKAAHWFLLSNGVLVFGILFFVFRRYLLLSKENHFKDDIWNALPQEKKAELAQAVDQIAHHSDAKQIGTAHDSRAKAEPKPEFLAPNFQGAPHEVLGLAPQPSQEQIQLAFRFWIKRYHPDRVSHLGANYVRQAVLRSEQLNRARAHLLKAARR